MRPSLLLALALPLLAGACFFGPSVEGFAPARTATGVGARLLLRESPRAPGDVLRGELLAVPDDTTLVVRDGVSFYRVRWRAVRTLTVADARIELRGGPRLPAKSAERLRLLSRFPQGITPALERGLLGAHGATAMVELP